jgi:hypothetical protein
VALPSLRLIETLRLGSGAEGADVPPITDMASLSIGFITELAIEGEREYIVRVDTFPFLYSLMEAMFRLKEKNGLRVEIGEGWWLLGTRRDNSYDTRVAFEAPGESQTILSCRLTAAEMMLFLSAQTAALAASLEPIGADVGYYLSKFSPAFR